MSYAEAMQRFGSDKPDLRIARAGRGRRPDGPTSSSRCSRVRRPIPKAASRRCGCPAGRADRARRSTTTRPTSAATARGVSPTSRSTTSPPGRDGLQSPILKFLPDEAVTEILSSAPAPRTATSIFFGADKARVVNDALGALRVKLGEDRGLIAGGWAPLWVVDFPMFEKDPQTEALDALHHPFTAPAVNDAEALRADPGGALSRAYDMVLNGSEIGGGSIRIHDQVDAAGGLPAAGDQPRGGGGEVRLPAGRAAIRMPAARRYRVRPRPHRHADGPAPHETSATSLLAGDPRVGRATCFRISASSQNYEPVIMVCGAGRGMVTSALLGLGASMTTAQATKRTDRQLGSWTRSTVDTVIACTAMPGRVRQPT